MKYLLCTGAMHCVGHGIGVNWQVWPVSCRLYWLPLFYRIFLSFAKFIAGCLGCLGHRQASIDYLNMTDFSLRKFELAVGIFVASGIFTRILAGAYNKLKLYSLPNLFTGFRLFYNVCTVAGKSNENPRFLNWR